MQIYTALIDTPEGHHFLWGLTPAALRGKIFGFVEAHWPAVMGKVPMFEFEPDPIQSYFNEAQDEYLTWEEFEIPDEQVLAQLCGCQVPAVVIEVSGGVAEVAMNNVPGLDVQIMDYDNEEVEAVDWGSRDYD